MLTNPKEQPLSALLNNFSVDDLQTLQEYMTEGSAVRGSVLLAEASNSRDMYFITAGSVDVYQKMEHSGQVMALRLARVAAPVIMGEANMLLGRKRNASVVAAEDIKYFELTYQNIVKLRSQHLGIYTKIVENCAELMARRMLDIQEQVQNRIVEQTEDPKKALLLLRILNSGVTVCQPVLAKKLFGSAAFFSE